VPGLSDTKAPSHRVRLNMLTEPGSNPKTKKNLALGYLTAGLHLAPAFEAGITNMCPAHTQGCAAACIFHAGRASFDPKIKAARIARTLLLAQDPQMFWALLRVDLMLLERAASKRGVRAACRLNVTSDIAWERRTEDGGAFSIIEQFPEVQFYDYTKRPGRVTPANYHLTFSRSESNQRVVLRELQRGTNVAVVFERELPATWHDRPVIDGDRHDCRFLDPEGVVVGLRAKGRRARDDDASGFVIR
jgi:hypothetical protein